MRSIRYLLTQKLGLRNVAVIVGLSNIALQGACVETAECDASVPCEDGQVCYDYECRAVCAGEEATCGAAATCSPCQQDDAEGEVNHCFTSTEWACLPDATP